MLVLGTRAMQFSIEILSALVTFILGFLNTLEVNSTFKNVYCFHCFGYYR